MFIVFLVGLFRVRIVLKLLLGIWIKLIGGRIFNGVIFIVNVIGGFVKEEIVIILRK